MNTPIDITVKPLTNISDVKKLELAQDLKTPAKTLTQLALDPYDLVRMDVAANWNTPSNVLHYLLNDIEPQVLQSLASNPAITPEMIQTLITDCKDDRILRTLCKNPKTTTQQLNLLAAYDKTFYQDIAAHQNASVELLNHIFNNPVYESNTNLATNPNTPQDLLAKLYHHSDPYIKFALSTNPNLQPEFLTEYSTMLNHPDVLVNVAANPNTPTNVLNILSKNTDPLIMARLAANPNTPTELLNHIIASPEVEPAVKYMLALNPVFPATVLQNFYDEGSRLMNVNLAKNPSTPETLLMELVVDADEKVRTAAYYNPNLNPDFRQAVIWAGGIQEDWFKEYEYQQKRVLKTEN